MPVEATQSPVKALATLPLCDEIERLARVEKTVAWLLCHHCAELADRFDANDPALSSYEDIYSLSSLRFGMPKRAVCERVRVGRALRKLPWVHIAFAEGKLSYAKVREVTRVADRDTEQQWIEAARTESVRSLERKVGRARRPETEMPSEAWTLKPEPTAGFVNVEMRLPGETWSIVRRAMEVARTRSARPLSDAEALEAVARWSLASGVGRTGPDTAAAARSESVTPDVISGASPGAEGILPFAAELRERLREEIAASDGPPETDTRPGKDHPDATRPGSDNIEAHADASDDDHDDLLTPAPGHLELSDTSIEPARMILHAIDPDDATCENDICDGTGLSYSSFASTMTELMLAGIVVRTHRGLALTRWAQRNRFRAQRSKRPR